MDIDPPAPCGRATGGTRRAGQPAAARADRRRACGCAGVPAACHPDPGLFTGYTTGLVAAAVLVLAGAVLTLRVLDRRTASESRPALIPAEPVAAPSRSARTDQDTTARTGRLTHRASHGAQPRRGFRGNLSP